MTFKGVNAGLCLSGNPICFAVYFRYGKSPKEY